MLNDYTGQHMGHIGDAVLGLAHNNAVMQQNANIVGNARLNNLRSMDYSTPLAMGMGLHHMPHHIKRTRREKGSIGIRGNLIGYGVPPALQSQPLSANFQFKSRLPPAYAGIGANGGGLYA
jgi:hypothetical protein